MISDESQLLIRIPASGNDETIAHADAFRVSIITEQDQKRKNKAIHSGANGWPHQTKIDPDKDNGSKNQNTNDNAGALPPIINHDEVLKSTKWTSYPAKGCSQSEQNKLLTMLKGKIPVSFSRYDCFRLFLELKHHQKTSMWTERAVLEELLFSLLSLSEEQLLDTANWESHPLVNHGKWLSDLHHCQWGGSPVASLRLVSQREIKKIHLIIHVKPLRNARSHVLRLVIEIDVMVEAFTMGGYVVHVRNLILSRSLI